MEVRTQLRLGLHVEFQLWRPILTKTGTFPQTSVNSSNTKFHENPHRSYRVVNGEATTHDCAAFHHKCSKNMI